MQVDLRTVRPVAVPRVIAHAGLGALSTPADTRELQVDVSDDPTSWRHAASATRNVASRTQDSLSGSMARYARLRAAMLTSHDDGGAQAYKQRFDAVSQRSFCFVHIDLDIYQAILEATRFFYTRVPAGGILLYDDYGFASCPGARAAVDEFFADKPEVPFVLSTGRCFVQKL